MYLTVKEAIDLSGKSQTTIHRFCQKYDDSKFIKKEGNKYLIDKDFLLEQYPKEEYGDEIIEQKDFISSNEVEERFIQELTVKNAKITELKFEKEKLLKEKETFLKKIEKLEEENFDLQHELADNIDENMGLHQEAEVLSNLEDIATSSPEEDKKTKKQLMLYQAILVTASLITLSAFVAFMYYFTK